ncbi:disease resistance protein [Striga asiatica]|uniref:Disease resistance protein n=1 Tax=Striga asiatica TaxID=4170 RepID=A0A5A7QDL9_STRAF|nr:disease resistance protein [Striga asiatica]
MTTAGGGATKLATALIVILSIALLALLAELLYLLRRRRRKAGQVPAAGDDEISQISADSSLSSFAASKDLLYLLCARPPPQFRVERNSATAADSDLRPDLEAIDFDLVKIHGVFGPPRFLFTIMEEEREDLEPPAGKHGGREIRGAAARRVSLEDHFRAAALDEEDKETVAPEMVVDIDGAGVDDTTPFSTPCASPVYFTPPASPAHGSVNGRTTQGRLMTSGIEQHRLHGQKRNFEVATTVAV